MCIIAAKPAGVSMIPRPVIRTMWNNNSDGAGFMYVTDGTVHIEKGFMKYKALAKALDRLENTLDLKKVPLVLHFRITTHGGTKPENCHPFPITDNVTALGKPVSNTSIGVAHNGIIPITPRKGISDTMEYIASQLAPLHRALPKFYENKHAMTMISNAIESKMAFLVKNGKIYTVGKFIEDNGVLYSNYSFEDWYGSYRGGYLGCYGEGWGPYDSGYLSGEDFYPDDYSKVLQWLKDSDCVSLADGTLVDGTDYLIDDENHVWLYDWETDMANPVNGASAHTANMTPLVFDMDSGMTDVVYVDTSVTVFPK